ncbi:MAG: type II toxin-antitoxin system Phd/YefM family antitoxin [Pseudomonadota bacterium]
MDPLLAGASISISEFKKNPSAAIAAADGFPVAILNRNKASAYLVPAAAWADLIERLEDADLAQIVRDRADEVPVPVSFDAL